VKQRCIGKKLISEKPLGESSDKTHLDSQTDHRLKRSQHGEWIIQHNLPWEKTSTMK
jgi:hypothetical protein